jgi:hypothetical protein
MQQCGRCVRIAVAIGDKHYEYTLSRLKSSPEQTPNADHFIVRVRREDQQIDRTESKLGVVSGNQLAARITSHAQRQGGYDRCRERP